MRFSFSLEPLDLLGNLHRYHLVSNVHCCSDRVRNFRQRRLSLIPHRYQEMGLIYESSLLSAIALASLSSAGAWCRAVWVRTRATHLYDRATFRTQQNVLINVLAGILGGVEAIRLFVGAPDLTTSHVLRLVRCYLTAKPDLTWAGVRLHPSSEAIRSLHISSHDRI